jgi:F0F1-type ATP synthase assembly protein I
MDKKTIKEIAVSSALYSLGSIFGPLILIGGSGYLLDKLFNTKPWLLMISIAIAFVTTNIMLFKRIKKINTLMDKYRDEVVKKKMEEVNNHSTSQEEN